MTATDNRDEFQGKPFRTLLQAAWETTAASRVAFLGFIAIFIVARLLDLASPWAIAYLINAFGQHGYTDTAFQMGIYGILTYVGLRLLSTFLLHLARYIQFGVAYQARISLLEKIFGALLTLPLPWHMRNHSGETIAKLGRVQATMHTFIEHHIWQLTEGVVNLVVILFTVTVLSYYISSFVVLGALVPVLLMVYFNRRLLTSIRDRIGFDNKLTRIALDYLSNIITVKTMGVERAAQRYLSRQRREGLLYTRRFAFLNEAKWQTVDVGNALIIGISLFLYLSLERQRGATFDVGRIYVLINYLGQIFQTIWGFASQYSSILETWAAYRDGEEILREADTYRSSSAVTERGNGQEWKELSLTGVSFSYGEGRAPVLNNVSFILRRSERVAVVGPNGGGKSTLMKALAGLLPATIERIEEDGVQLGREDLSRRVLLIPQDPEIFNETLRYNLTLGEEYSDESLQAAAGAAALGAVIERMPLGWETNLMQKGLNLSGGEKQRIALARGMLRAAERDILLLDEPTSSVDARTEKVIFENVLASVPKKAVISSLHRLQLIPFFDRVILMDQGQIVEDGTVVELLRRKGEFYKIWSDFVKKSSTMWLEGEAAESH